MKNIVLATLALAGLAASVNAGVLITPGNLVTYRVGTGTGTLSNAGTAVFVDEYTTSGTLVQSIALPTSGINAFVASGTATSEGGLTISPDGRYITITGYNAMTGTTGIAATTSANVARTVAIIDTTTGNTTYTRLDTASFSGNNIRSAVSDGTNIWAAGANSGVRYTTVGSGTTVQLSTTSTNNRQVNIFNGQLYVTSGSSTIRTASVGTGTPTTSGQTIANLPGTASTGSPYQYFFADLSATVAGVDTLYIADDSAGLQKFALVGGSWVARGTVGTGTNAYRGLTATVDAGVVTLFATGNGTSLVTLTDSSGYNANLTGSVTALAAAGTNTAIRGIGYIPVPTPGSLALLGLGGLVAARRRR